MKFNMKLSKKLLEYLQNTRDYEYTGWIEINVTSLHEPCHIEWCTIKINSITISIRQDNYGEYYVSIGDSNHSCISDADDFGRPYLLTHGKLEDSENLIHFLKNLPETRYKTRK